MTKFVRKSIIDYVSVLFNNWLGVYHHSRGAKMKTYIKHIVYNFYQLESGIESGIILRILIKLEVVWGSQQDSPINDLDG